MRQITMLLAFSALAMLSNQAYAMWMPLTQEELSDQSKTVFVGTIQEVNPVEVEYQSQISQNGTLKQSIGPEVMTLDEYTVNVEEFLQNPQDYDTIKLIQATVGGVPGGPARIGGFDKGDRVLFYIPKDPRQTHFEGQYLPESFKMPKSCDARTVIKEPRILYGSSFSMTQNGVQKKDNYTAGVPITFSYDIDARTLDEKSYNVTAWMVKHINNGTEPVLSKTIKTDSKQCQWIASARWEFTPDEGEYTISYGTDGYGMSDGTFHVVQGLQKIKSPLQQFRSGISISNIQCMEGLVKVVRASYGSPACVRPETKQKLIEIGWAKDSTAKDCNDIDAKKEAQCLVDAFNSCEQAFANEVSYTVEGDPTYIETTIAKDCKIHVSHDISEDRFGGYEKDVYSYTCSKISIEKDDALKISSCQEPNTLYIGFLEQDASSEVECTKMNGTWSYEYHNCYGIDKDQCQVAGGMQSCMGYDQMGNGRDVCKMVCEMQPQDRK